MKKVPSPSHLAVAVAIVVGNKKMLVCEDEEGYIELPGFVIVPEEKAQEAFQKLNAQMGLTEKPQQTLYLTNISVSKSKKKQLPALIRVTHFDKSPQFDFPKARFEPFSKLVCDDRATALTVAVAEWITR